MSTFADEIADALADVRAETGISATYLRGATEIDLTEVGRGTKVFRFTDEYQTTKRTETSDFFIEASQLDLEPTIGDRIQETVGDQLYTYELVSINNEPCFRWSDPGHTQLRIHTLKVNTEDA